MPEPSTGVQFSGQSRHLAQKFREEGERKNCHQDTKHALLMCVSTHVNTGEFRRPISPSQLRKFEGNVDRVKHDKRLYNLILYTTRHMPCVAAYLAPELQRITL